MLQLSHPTVSTYALQMMADFSRMLSEQGFQAQHVTPAALDSALEKHRVQLTTDVEKMLDQKLAAVQTQSKGAGAGENANGWPVYWWRKGAEPNACPRIVPECYTLPVKVSPQIAWQQWWGPHTSDVSADITYPPIKACTCFHLPRSQQPRWSEWNTFFAECMECIPEALKKQLTDAYKLKNVPLPLLNDTYRSVLPVVDKYRAKQRSAQLRFATVLRNWGAARAAARAATRGGGDV